MVEVAQGGVFSTPVSVLGGGLAGCEAAWQLAVRGVPTRLVEMRPHRTTPAHHTADLGEIVCSNSLKSEDSDTAAGLLKTELDALGSIVLAVARAARVPAGSALAVDRVQFARTLTQKLREHPLIEIVREEARAIPDGRVIVATGPLTSPGLEPAIAALVGDDRLAFYDAAAPIVDAATVDHSVVFAQSRYDRGSGADYLNAPLNADEYAAFYAELVNARRVAEKDFEPAELFQACKPVEEIARSGSEALRFGALKPVGLVDPRSGRRPWAVVQLRAENSSGTAYNLVGFQTNLRFSEQERVFRMIPGLQRAEFLRYGVMHRNTFVDAPRLLDSTLAVRSEPRIRLAGQLTGTEGYCEAAASGLLAALNTFADIAGLPPVLLPATTALGSLIAYATDPETIVYQPMHVNFGLLPPVTPSVRGKRERYSAYGSRARSHLAEWKIRRSDLFDDGLLRVARI